MRQASQAVNQLYFCLAVSDPSCSRCLQIDEHPAADVIVPTSTGSKSDHKVETGRLMSQILKLRSTMLSGGYQMLRDRRDVHPKSNTARNRQLVILSRTL